MTCRCVKRPSLGLKLKADILLLLNNISQKYGLIEYYLAQNALSFKRYTFTHSHILLQAILHAWFA
jgi:hypothetical protein